jgi:predicted tellurium resistance membrane protein TerC
MEADIERAILILGLMFAIVFIVRGLGAIASMIDMFKFAYGAFVLLGTTPLALALVGSLRDKETSIRRCYANPIIMLSALATMRGRLPKPQ